MPFDEADWARRQFSDPVLAEAYRIVQARHHPVDLLGMDCKQVTREIYAEVRRLDLSNSADTRDVTSDD